MSRPRTRIFWALWVDGYSWHPRLGWVAGNYPSELPPGTGQERIFTRAARARHAAQHAPSPRDFCGRRQVCLVKHDARGFDLASWIRRPDGWLAREQR